MKMRMNIGMRPPRTALSLLAQAIAILARYGGSLWVADPAYTFTSSAGTGAASDGSDAGYGRDLCATYGPELRAGKFNNSDGATFTNNVDGSTTVTTNGSQTYAYAGWYADVVQGTVYEVATNANASSRWIYYLHTPGQTDYVNVGSTATGVVGEARNIVSVPTAQGTRTRLLVVRQVGPEFGAGSFIAQPASVREVVGRPLFQSTTSFKPKLKRVPKRLGPELVTNGDFSQGSTGWTVVQPTSGAVTFDGAKATILSNDGTMACILKTSLLTIGKQYQLSADVVVRTGSCIIGDNAAAVYGQTVSSSTIRNTFAATTANLQVKRGAGGLPNDFDIDNVSIREVLEWGWAWVFDGTDDVLATVSQPAAGSESFIVAKRLYALPAATGPYMFKRGTNQGAHMYATTSVYNNTEIGTGSAYVYRSGPQVGHSVNSLVLSPTTRQVRVNAVSDGGAAVTYVSADAVIKVGAGVFFYKGEIFAAAYAPAAIPDAELLIVERAIGALAGVTI